MIIRKIGIVSASVLTLALTGAPALAVGVANEHASAQAASAGSQSDTAGSQAGTKLADAKLKACQNREKAINNILARIADRGQKQLDLFTTIATRTETFYTTKGKTLSNYDALVADVTAKQTAAQTTVTSIKSDSVSFKCDGTDPKGAITSFKTDLTSEISALKDYRTSVKNLIVGVKSVQSTTTSTDNSTTGGSQ